MPLEADVLVLVLVRYANLTARNRRVPCSGFFRWVFGDCFEGFEFQKLIKSLNCKVTGALSEEYRVRGTLPLDYVLFCTFSVIVRAYFFSHLPSSKHGELNADQALSGVLDTSFTQEIYDSGRCYATGLLCGSSLDWGSVLMYEYHHLGSNLKS